MSVTSDTLSFELWLQVEYDIYQEDYKRYDKRLKSDLKREYERYVSQASTET